MSSVQQKVSMDNRRRAVIERYVQAVRFHGLGLLQLTREEQGDGGDSVMGFVFPHCKDINSASYFKNRLQTSCPAVVDGQTSWKEYCKADVEHGTHCGTEGRCHAQFEEKLHRFIATKADLLFGIQGKNQIQQNVGCGRAANQEVLKLYANPPPLETLMAVPVSVRRAELFKILQVGSIVLGEVTSKRPFGIFVKLTALEFSKHRELTGLHVEALCRTTDLGGCAREYQDPTDAFVVGDKVRGVVSGVSAEEERISLSFRVSRLLPEFENLQLGVIDETPSSDAPRDLRYNEDKSYEDYLKSDVGFNNPRSLDTLIEELGIDEQAPCSLLRRIHRISYPEGDFAEALRKKQSAKWSMETTAKGVEHFKAGNHDAADKYFEHALQIDSENVEALVARGALAANRGQLARAVKDFRRALTISGSHRNAHKYLTATLVEQGIQFEKEGDLEDALECFKEALGFDPGQDTAREHLKNVQQQINQRNQKKDKDAAKKQESASQFRHVRQLIKAEQNQAKKSKMARKKKKKGKSQKKKKKQVKSKSRRRSRRSSSSEQSSQDSSSSPTWIENAGAERREKPGTGNRRTSGSGRRSGPEYSADEEAHGRDMERGSSELRQSSNSAAGKGKARRTRTRSRSSSSSTSNKHETKDRVKRNKAKRKRSGSFDSPARLGSVSLSSDEDRSKNKQFSHKSRRTNRARRSYSFNSSDADKDDRALSRSRSAISGESRSRDRKTLPLKYKRKHRSRSRSTDSSNSRRDERAQTRSRSPVRRALSSERRGRDESPRPRRKRLSRSRSYSSSGSSSIDNKRTRRRSMSREKPKKGSRR